MRVSRQFVTFGAMVLVAGMFLPTSPAQAFGQQWRPTVTAMPAQTTAHRRVVNVPSFRPHVSAASPRYRPSRTVRTRPVMQPMVAMRPMAPRTHPGPAPQRFGHAAPGGWPSMPMWSNPWDQMAQIWRNPMPMYPSGYVRRPVEQPWISQYARPQPPRHQSANPAVPNEYRPHKSLSAVHGTGHAPVWRQVHPANATPRVAPSRAVRVGHGPTPGGLASPGATRMPQFAAVGMQRGYWRPDQAAMAQGFAHSDRFRPATYGRSASRERLPTQPRTVAQKLPGWVTTHQDTGNLFTCNWCSGS